MSKNEAQSEPVEEVLSRMEASISELKAQNKGFKGQISQLRAASGLPRPGTKVEKPESSPNQALATDSKPQEAPKLHQTYEWMRGCPECGGRNPDYKAPTVACSNCGVPLSSSAEAKAELLKDKHTDKVKPCWNCGKEKVKILG